MPDSPAKGSIPIMKISMSVNAMEMRALNNAKFQYSARRARPLKSTYWRSTFR